MKLHTCMVSYNRLEATKRALESYLETVSIPYTFVVVDNHSQDGTVEWLRKTGYPHILLDANYYPGYACNRGWELAPTDADLFHRADNDFIYRKGWCNEMMRRFNGNRKLGQLGLRTDEEEAFAPMNVGGNCVIRRKLWDQGLRWDERPWTVLEKGYSEDSFFSPAVRELGYDWARVTRSCIDGITTPSKKDPYYQETYAARDISGVLEGIHE